jgi:hypothetical protein
MKKMLITLLSITGLTLLFASSTASAAPTSKAKPFLIQGKLPHLSMRLKLLWNDEDLALSTQQKEKLLLIRQDTMKGAKVLSKKINPLEKKIVQAGLSGKEPGLLKAEVEYLASLRAQATMIHLQCIYETKKVLTKEQLAIIE